MSAPAAAASAAAPDPEAEQQRRLRRIYGAIVLSAVLSYASFHPMDLGFLAWVALVPLLVIGGRERLRVAAVMAFSATTLYHIAGLSWIAMVTPEGWLLTSFLEGLYGLALICLPLWLRRRTGLPLVATLGIWGVVLECVRSNCPFIGFPWLLWGSSQHARDTLIQIADLASVYGLSFLVLTVNAAVADVALLVRQRFDEEHDLSPADKQRLLQIVAAPVALVVLALGYGGFRRSQVEQAMKKDPGPRVLLVQVDLPQSVKDSDQRTTIFQLAQMNLGLSEAAVRWNAGRPVDAMLWSETMWPWPLPDDRTPAGKNGWDEWFAGIQARHSQGYASALTSYLRRLLDLPTRLNAPLCVGAVDYGLDGHQEHNSYYCIAPDPPRQARVVNRYDKVELVPVSEYIPFKGSTTMGWFFRLMKSLVPPGFTVFAHGKEITSEEQLFEAGKYKLAPNICFEISFPELLRHATLAGADAHVCPANDGWFVRGFPPEQATATAEVPLAKDHAQLRAIENRRPVFRCVNRGISLAYDPTGHLVGEVEKFVDGKRVTVGVTNYLGVQVPTTDLLSIYVRFGDWFPLLCALAMTALIVLGVKGKQLLPPTEGVIPPEPRLLARPPEEPPPEADAQPKDTAQPEDADEAKAEPEADAEAKPETDAEPEPEHEAEHEADADAQPEQEQEQEHEHETETETEATPEAQPEQEHESEARPDATDGDSPKPEA